MSEQPDIVHVFDDNTFVTPEVIDHYYEQVGQGDARANGGK